VYVCVCVFVDMCRPLLSSLYNDDDDEGVRVPLFLQYTRPTAH
jgi:hypothetical protein